MHSVELAPTPGEPPMLLLLMVVVAILVFRVGIRNYIAAKAKRNHVQLLRDRLLLWAKGVGLMLAAGTAVIWPSGRLIGAW